MTQVIFYRHKGYGRTKPSNTTLTIKYSHGGGLDDNVASDTITSLTEFNYTLDTSTLDGGVVEIVTDSVGVTNPRPTSFPGTESIEELKSTTQG